MFADYDEIKRELEIMKVRILAGIAVYIDTQRSMWNLQLVTQRKGIRTYDCLIQMRQKQINNMQNRSKPY
jgi:hypothetical protein